MTIYGVAVGDESSIYFATQREAFGHARTETKHHALTEPDNATAIVERVQLVPLTKAVIVRLVNVSGGYVDSTEVIARFERGKRVHL